MRLKNPWHKAGRAATGGLNQYPEIIGIGVPCRLRDRWSDKFFDTIYTSMQIFLLAKFATALLTLLTGDKYFE